MALWARIKQALQSFMVGRHGMDQLSKALLWVGLGVYFFGSLIRLDILSLLGFAAYGVAIFRALSRNSEKRRTENRRFLSEKNKVTKKWKQARARYENRKKYRYFKCPGCKAWLRLPRGSGVVTVTCSRCQNHFTEKA